MEIYNETLIDLLNIKKTVKIKETFHGVKVDATYKVTTSPEEVLELMREVNINLYYFYQVFASYNLTLYLLRLFHSSISFPLSDNMTTHNILKIGWYGRNGVS